MENSSDKNAKIESCATGTAVGFQKRTTCFADPAMGTHSIKLDEACVMVIRTPQFQRLHSIKQTGGCYLVYPSAVHMRFSHSIGTCYLAGEVMRRLRDEQPELNITERDILVVKLAALCHDIGHGPWSHTFDQKFIPRARPGHKWEHEDASIAMFRHMLKKNPDVDQYLRQILKDEDFIFIEEAIKTVDESKYKDWPYKGRPFEKAFMYDIVSNKTNGYDVDRFDYVKRDSIHLSVATNANLNRLQENMRVIPVPPNNRPSICYRDKVQLGLANLAHTRYQLHAQAYQHRTVKIIEQMSVDAWVIADKHILLPGTDGKQVCLSDSIDDMDAYLYATDDFVMGMIRSSTSAELKPAREIFQRIDRRQLYDKIGEQKISDPDHVEKFKGVSTENISLEVAGFLPECQNQFSTVDGERLASAISVEISDIHGGMKDENPVGKVHFYKKYKKAAYRLKKHELDIWPPPRRLLIIRAVCRETDPELVACAKRCFALWCKSSNLIGEEELEDEEDSDSDNESGGRQ